MMKTPKQDNTIDTNQYHIEEEEEEVFEQQEEYNDDGIIDNDSGIIEDGEEEEEGISSSRYTHFKRKQHTYYKYNHKRIKRSNIIEEKDEYEEKRRLLSSFITDIKEDDYSKLFKGLEEYEEGKECKYVLHMPYDEKDVDKRFPNQKQYKLTFDNHYIMYLFVSLFMRKKVRISSSTTTDSSTTTTIYQEDPDDHNLIVVGIIDFEVDKNHVRAIKPLNKYFRSDNFCDYFQRQLIQFKSKDDELKYNFHIQRKEVGLGLLHPSFPVPGYSRKSSMVNNIYDNMNDSKMESLGYKQFSYQMLYIDLYDTLVVRKCIDDIYEVDYTTRKFGFTPQYYKKKVVTQQGGDSVDVIGKQTVAVSMKKIAKIKNQPDINTFFSLSKLVNNDVRDEKAVVSTTQTKKKLVKIKNQPDIKTFFSNK